MKALFLILSMSSCLSIGCTTDLSELYPYDPPRNLDDGLEVGTLEEVKIDTQGPIQT